MNCCKYINHLSTIISLRYRDVRILMSDSLLRLVQRSLSPALGEYPPRSTFFANCRKAASLIHSIANRRVLYRDIEKRNGDGEGRVGAGR